MQFAEVPMHARQEEVAANRRGNLDVSCAADGGPARDGLKTVVCVVSLVMKQLLCLVF